MNAQIEFYVEQMEASLMMNLVNSKKSNLYDIASDMITEDQEQMLNICQAYEVVKHALLG